MINADDFGLSDDVNLGIISLFESNIISNASAMVCAKKFEEGLNKLDKKYHQKLGLHLCLDSDGDPISEISEIPSLIDKKTGKFYTRKKLVFKILSGQVKKSELKKEILFQFNKLTYYGIKPHHFDGHGHIHVIPQIASILSDLAKKEGIKYVRKPIEYNLKYQLFRFNRRFILSVIIALFSYISFKKFYKGLNTSHAFFGLLNSGKINISFLKSFYNLIKGFPSCSVELMCHPGFKTKKSLYDRWDYNWQTEYQALMEIVPNIRSHKNILLST